MNDLSVDASTRDVKISRFEYECSRLHYLIPFVEDR
jgi:hypothetical protein